MFPDSYLFVVLGIELTAATQTRHAVATEPHPKPLDFVSAFLNEKTLYHL